MYHAGQGCEVNIEKAIQWYLRAAEQNYAQSQQNVGALFFKKQDYANAYLYFQLALAQGIGSVENIRNHCLEMLTTHEIEKANLQIKNILQRKITHGWRGHSSLSIINR